MELQAELGDDRKNTFTPTDLRKEFGVTARALRFYQVKGLLNPERKGLARNYDRRDRARLALILKCKRFGLTLQEIRSLLDVYDVDHGVTQRRVALELFDQQAEHLRTQINEMTAGLQELGETCEELRQIQRDNGEIMSARGSNDQTGES